MTLELSIAVLMTLAVVAFVGIFFSGRRYIHKGRAATPPLASGPWPPVAVIIPVAGVYPGLAGNLRSRLTQDYPASQVILVTRSEADPAFGLIQTLLPDFPRARVLVSGPAAGCGQKNHNLLAGVAAVAPEVEILVFADANQWAPAHWLQNLVRPLLAGEAAVSSSFHHIRPQDYSLATLGRSFMVLLIYLGKGIPGWDQPWGGSTAIRREAFQELAVDQLWSRTVVDDVTLAKRLKQARMRMVPASGAELATPAAESLASYVSWLTRQLLYLKFYSPGAWLLAGVGIFLLLGLVLVALGQLLTAMITDAAWVRLAPSSLFLSAGLIVLALLRRLHPAPGPKGRYFAAAFLTLGLSAWSHARTWGRRELRWRHLVYTVNPQGEVTHIREG